MLMTAKGTLRALLSVFVAAGLSTAVHAQVDSSAVPKPAEMKPGLMYFVDGEKLVEVPETPIEVGAGTSASGVGAAMLGFGSGVKSFMILLGTTSEMLITDTQPRFRVMTDRPSSQRLRLARFEVKKDKRQARTESAHLLEFFKPAVPIEVTKVAEGLYEFRPTKPLAPGEYAFASSQGGPAVADFTIVGTGGKKK
jgi:hypothetical protein